jgi:hypothetical protein
MHCLQALFSLQLLQFGTLVLVVRCTLSRATHRYAVSRTSGAYFTCNKLCTVGTATQPLSFLSCAVYNPERACRTRAKCA